MEGWPAGEIAAGWPGRVFVGKESHGARGTAPRQTGAEGQSHCGLGAAGPRSPQPPPAPHAAGPVPRQGSAPGQLSPQDSHRGTHTPLTTVMPYGHVCRAKNTFLPTKLNQKWQDASLALRIIIPPPEPGVSPGEQGRCREGARPGTRGHAGQQHHDHPEAAPHRCPMRTPPSLGLLKPNEALGY